MNDKVTAENEFMKSNKYIWRPSETFVLFLILTFNMYRGEKNSLNPES